MTRIIIGILFFPSKDNIFGGKHPVKCVEKEVRLEWAELQMGFVFISRPLGLTLKNISS